MRLHHFEEKIKAEVKGNIIGRRIYYYEELPSTNDEAKRLLEGEVEEGTVVAADGQSRGRGRFNREWFSPAGKGIYLSVILKPYVNFSEVTMLSLLAALAACRAIRGMTGLEVAVKWPNDIVTRGKKLGGVLAEAVSRKGGREGVVVGVGINLRSTEFPAELNATSLEAEGVNLAPRELLTPYLREFDKLYNLYLKQGASEILGEWKTVAADLGEWVRVETEAGAFEGLAAGIGEGGELLLKDNNGGIRKFLVGEVSRVGSQR